MLSMNTPENPAGRQSDIWILDMARTPLGAPGGALHEVQPAALLAGLITAINGRSSPQDGFKLPLDALVIGAAADGSVVEATLSAALARADASITSTAGLLEGGSEAGADAVRLAVAQLRAGEAGLVLAGGIHFPSRTREQRRANPDVLGALAAQAVTPHAAADVAMALQGIRAQDVMANVDALRRVGSPATPDAAVTPVLDLNGLTILASDHVAVDVAGAAPLANDAPWQAHHALARAAFPQLGEIKRVHAPQIEAPALEGACMLLLARADVASGLGLSPRARITACAKAGHRRLHVIEATRLAFDQALQRAGWSSRQIDMVEAGSRFAGLSMAVVRALHLQDTQSASTAAGWWHSNAGAVSPVLALWRLAGRLEQAGLRRGALICAGDGGSSVVILVERGNDD